MPSSAITRHELRSERAFAFVNQFRSNNSGTGIPTNDNHLYTFIGREDDPQGEQLVEPGDGTFLLSGAFDPDSGAWGILYPDDDGNSDDEPPAAVKNIRGANRFWATAIAGKKVAPSEIHLMIPRKNWTSGTVYNPRVMSGLESEAWYDASSPGNDFYILNSDDEVWICVARDFGLDPGDGSLSEPKLATGGLVNDLHWFRDRKNSIIGADVNGVINSGDGYVWKYLFTLTSSLITNLLLDDWIPVPCTNDTLMPVVAETALGERTKGRDDAYSLLGARHVIIRSVLTAGEAGSGLLPSGLRYRQVALVKNPVAAGTFTRLNDPVVYQANTENGPTNEVEPFVGDMIYLENRSPITREVNQTEEFKTIFVF